MKKKKIIKIIRKIKYINKVHSLHYYCRNNDISKSSLDGKRHCVSKMNFDKNNNNYTLITDISAKCRELDNIQLENIQIARIEIENKEKYK